MRVVSTVIIVLFLMANATSAETARRVSVSELAENPTAYFDQRLVVTGVIRQGAWGPNLCEFRSQVKNKQRDCTDLADVNLPFDHYDWEYHFAVVEVVGYFTHSCYRGMITPETLAEDEVVEVVCMDRGGNGWLTAESIRVIGAAAECEDEGCSRGEKVTEIALNSPEAVGIDTFVAQVVPALRTGRAEHILPFVLPVQRTELEWYSKRDPAWTGRWVGRGFASARVMLPNIGYRLVRIDDDPPSQQLCFCETGDCAQSWRYAGRTLTALRRLPIRCFYVWRGLMGWVLVY